MDNTTERPMLPHATSDSSYNIIPNAVEGNAIIRTEENSVTIQQPYNPPLSDDLIDVIDRMKGDAIGETLYSSRFVLQTLIKLQEYVSSAQVDPERQPTALSENETFEKDLCTLWDMTINKDVVLLLQEREVLDLFTVIVVQSMDQRLCEILLGIIGNMCTVNVVRKLLCENNEILPSLLSLVSCTDSLVLVQLMRLISSAITFNNNNDQDIWFNHLRLVPNFFEHLSEILSKSLHSQVLIHSMEALAAMCSKFTVVDEQQTPDAQKESDLRFRNMFLNDHLIVGVFDAFRQLTCNDNALQINENATADDDDEDDETAAPTKRTRKIMNTFLDIQFFLTQCNEHSRTAYANHLDTLFLCISIILRPLCKEINLFPITNCTYGIIENMNEMLFALGDVFSSVCFVQMVRIWHLLFTNKSDKLCKLLKGTENDEYSDIADYESTDGDDDTHIVDALLECISRFLRCSTSADLESCFLELELSIIQSLYHTIHRGIMDPVIREISHKMTKVAHQIWSIDLKLKDITR